MAPALTLYQGDVRREYAGRSESLKTVTGRAAESLIELAKRMPDDDPLKDASMLLGERLLARGRRRDG